jgi:hypothetical protein
MFFEFVKCKKCNQQSHPNYNLTIDSYKDDGFFTVPLEVVPNDQPPKVPTYLIFECSNVKCKNRERLEHSDILVAVSTGLANIAWDLYKQELKKSVTFEQYMTRYLLDKGTNSFIREENLVTHPILKEYIKLIRGNK